jgi:hypothetical protein
VAIDEVAGQVWARKHDDPMMPAVLSAPRTLYPKSLEELIEICAKRQPAERIRAAGSHWALSEAAIADTVFVETHDPTNRHQAMGRTLYDVVPPCLNKQFVDNLAARVIAPFDTNTVTLNEGLYPMHIETGKRVYQMYSELDWGDDDPQSLAVLLDQKHGNSSYLGSWGFRTLGGAGGQTVFGALTTGTHGGDFNNPPIADSVLAMHLVTDGGRHYWIEPETLTPLEARLTDDAPLRALYGQDRFGGPDMFEVIRDDNIFNSVLIAAGRFGIVYSIVVAAVRQYCMHQERRLSTWQAIKGQVGDPTSALYTTPADNKFLQIAISVTPFENFTKNLAGISKRWNVALAAIPGTMEPAGRPERRGNRLALLDPMIQAPLFEFAGNSFTWSPDPARPGMALPPNFLERACSNADFMAGVVQSVMTEVENFVNSNGAVAGATIAAITAAGGGAALVALIPALLVILAILALLLAAILSNIKPRFGQTMNDLRNELLNRTDPDERAAGLFVWQLIAFEVFSSQQGTMDCEAISYAVMDGHDYFDKSCNINVDSIEVFFDATDPMLIAFVDALLAFEIGQETMDGKAFVGYISMRFTGPTRALIGQERFPLTCAVEVAGLRDVTGVTELIDFAITLALDSNFSGIMHWGQRNESTRAHIEERFGDTLTDRTGTLHTWRAALSRLTEHGRLDGFSSAFTRRTGLEIVTPAIGRFAAHATIRFKPIVVDWDCTNNPSVAQLQLDVTAPSGAHISVPGLGLIGQEQIAATEAGPHQVVITAALDLNGQRRTTTQQATVLVG